MLEPDFYRKGYGVCRELTNEQKDDFNDDQLIASGVMARERAKEWCRICPFAEECAAWAQSQGYSGVWGGRWFVNGIERIDREVSRRARQRAAA